MRFLYQFQKWEMLNSFWTHGVQKTKQHQTMSMVNLEPNIDQDLNAR